jgi:hypothetical protein
MAVERSSRRFNPFRILTQEARKRHLAAYLHFLRINDGNVDFERWLLTHRERYLEGVRLEPVRSRRGVDLATFERNVRSHGSGDLEPWMAWLVVAAKANIGESYGVDRELQWITSAQAARTMDELHLRMLMQERYHSQILQEVCRTIGVEVQTPLPNWNQRVLIQIIMRLPDSIRWALVICAEVVGSTVFEILLRNCVLFSDEPEVEERLRSLLGEIRRDEVLHVAYLRARLSPIGLAIARWLSPVIARGALVDLPQLAALGATRCDLLRRMREGLEIPSDAPWIDSDPIPGTTFSRMMRGLGH